MTYKTNKPEQNKTKKQKPLDQNIFPRRADVIKSELLNAYKISKIMPLTSPYSEREFNWDNVYKLTEDLKQENH